MHLSVYPMARRRLLSVCENLHSPSVTLRQYSDYLHHRLPIPSCLSASLHLRLGADRTALRSGDTGIDFDAYRAWFCPLSWVCAKLIQWVNESNSIRKSVRNRFIVCPLLSLVEATIRRCALISSQGCCLADCIMNFQRLCKIDEVDNNSWGRCRLIPLRRFNRARHVKVYTYPLKWRILATWKFRIRRTTVPLLFWEQLYTQSVFSRGEKWIHRMRNGIQGNINCQMRRRNTFMTHHLNVEQAQLYSSFAVVRYYCPNATRS